MQQHWVQFGNQRIDVLDPKLDLEPLGPEYYAFLFAWIRDTYESCTYYRSRLTSAGLSIQSINSIEAFEQIPPIGPRHVSGDWSVDNQHPASEFDLLPDKYREAAALGTLSSFSPEEMLVHKFMSTSTTGRPKCSSYTGSDWDTNCAETWRRHRHIGLRKMNRILNCFHAGHFGGQNVNDTFVRLGCIVENRHFAYTDDESVMGQLRIGLSDIGGFNAMFLPPWSPKGPTKGVSLDGLLRVDSTNYIGRNIRVISLGGASSRVPGLDLRERVADANRRAGVEPTLIMDKYGANEIGITHAECGLETGIHVFYGTMYSEIIDEKTFRHVKSGERGLVAMTGLRNGSRFLRYLCGDEATYIAEKCSCGRVSPRFKDITRVLDKERIRGGCASA